MPVDKRSVCKPTLEKAAFTLKPRPIQTHTKRRHLKHALTCCRGQLHYEAISLAVRFKKCGVPCPLQDVNFPTLTVSTHDVYKQYRSTCRRIHIITDRGKTEVAWFHWNLGHSTHRIHLFISFVGSPSEIQSSCYVLIIAPLLRVHCKALLPWFYEMKWRNSTKKRGGTN